MVLAPNFEKLIIVVQHKREYRNFRVSPSGYISVLRRILRRARRASSGAELRPGSGRLGNGLLRSCEIFDFDLVLGGHVIGNIEG